MKIKKIFLCVGMILVTFTIFDHANADLEFRSNPKTLTPNTTSVVIGSEPSIPTYQLPQKNSINSTPKGIQMHFREYPLGEILKNIHDETGIHFNISPQMAKKLISVSIEAKHWKNSVLKLVEDYSRVEVWTNQPKTSQIWIIESNPYN
jgi:type II secretory pathway component GspD/PulD (secretin)